MSKDEDIRADEPGDDDIEIVEVVGLGEETVPAARTGADEVEVFFEDEKTDPVRSRGVEAVEIEPRESAQPEGANERERLMRLRAEFENLQKRFDREREETVRHANATLVSNLLPVIDNLERALTSEVSETNDQTFRDGVSLIYRQLTDELRKAGLRRVDAVGKLFDPTLHEAMATDDSGQHAPNTVVEELQRGYVFQKRLIRPSLVRVAVQPSEGGSDDEAGESSDHEYGNGES